MNRSYFATYRPDADQLARQTRAGDHAHRQAGVHPIDQGQIPFAQMLIESIARSFG